MVRSKEVNWPGGVLCYCGEQINFRPMDSLKVRPIWKEDKKSEKNVYKSNHFEKSTNPIKGNYTFPRKSQVEEKPSPSFGGKQEIYEELVAGLTRLGYKRGEAQRRASKSIEKCGPAPIEKLLQEALL